jgi:hypothetical protein
MFYLTSAVARAERTPHFFQARRLLRSSEDDGVEFGGRQNPFRRCDHFYVSGIVSLYIGVILRIVIGWRTLQLCLRSGGKLYSIAD